MRQYLKNLLVWESELNEKRLIDANLSLIAFLRLAEQKEQQRKEEEATRLRELKIQEKEERLKRDEELMMRNREELKKQQEKVTKEY